MQHAGVQEQQLTHLERSRRGRYEEGCEGQRAAAENYEV